MPTPLLIIEDDANLAASLRKGLCEQDYDAVVTHSAEEARKELASRTPDLIILDLGLPGENGLSFLKSIRQQGATMPVLILTARDTVDDRVYGLEQGADDYLVKPFAFSELLARIRALLRRAAPAIAAELRVMDLELDLIKRTAIRQGEPIDLRPREFDLLVYLARHEGNIVSREMLIRDVWKLQSRATSMDNIIDVNISHIRQKLDKNFNTPLLHTVRGVGFRLGDPL